MKILGAVLAGGRSTRFGSDKALACWRGRTLLEHAWSLLEEVCDERVLCGRGYAAMPSIEDRPSGGRGPLGGLNAALHYAQIQGFDRVISLACDTPEVPADLLSALASAPDALCLSTLPVIGGWPVVLAPELDQFIVTDPCRSVFGWASMAKARLLQGWQVRNINTTAELMALDSALG